MNEIKVREIIEAHPKLGLFGFNNPADELAASREELADSWRYAVLASWWLRSLPFAKAADRAKHESSYGIKHAFENVTRVYVPDGVFTVGAYLAGCPVLELSKSAILGIPQRALKPFPLSPLPSEVCQRNLRALLDRQRQEDPELVDWLARYYRVETAEPQAA